MKSAQEFTVAGNGRSLSGWRAFTLIELLVVISIIGILAALVVGLVGVATKKSRESQVRAMLAQLVTAIESYKAAKGHYPPDNAANPAQPQLFYELIGTFSTDGGATFTTKDRLATVTSVMLNTAFGSGEHRGHCQPGCLLSLGAQSEATCSFALRAGRACCARARGRRGAAEFLALRLLQPHEQPALLRFVGGVRVRRKCGNDW
jgi:prepilin-type N-terminal cleavage/methylation domain-containing protein